MATRKNKISLVDFPEEVGKSAGMNVRVYGETSYENQMAVLSHWLHNHRKDLGREEQSGIIESIRDFLSRKEMRQKVDISDWSDEQLLAAAEAPTQYGLFSDFFDVPFPAPENPKFTFIDLFAGMGGIRIPFDEMNYHCVFSSEWDAKACKTYFANFGTVPFGDITKIPAERIPRHDVLLAGFPCQAFSIMGKMQGFADTRGTMFFDAA